MIFQMILTDFETICHKRGCKLKGDEPDIEKAAILFLDDYRGGKIGQITLETV